MTKLAYDVRIALLTSWPTTPHTGKEQIFSRVFSNIRTVNSLFVLPHVTVMYVIENDYMSAIKLNEMTCRIRSHMIPVAFQVSLHSRLRNK